MQSLMRRYTDCPLFDDGSFFKTTTLSFKVPRRHHLIALFLLSHVYPSRFYTLPYFIRSDIRIGNALYAVLEFVR